MATKKDRKDVFTINTILMLFSLNLAHLAKQNNQNCLNSVMS